MIERFLKKKKRINARGVIALRIYQKTKNKKQKQNKNKKTKWRNTCMVKGKHQFLPFGHIFPLPMLVIYSSFNLLKNKSPARGIHINYLGQYLSAHLLI